MEIHHGGTEITRKFNRKLRASRVAARLRDRAAWGVYNFQQRARSSAG